MVLDYNNNVPNNKEFSMAQINQKPKTGIYKLQDGRIVKVNDWISMYDDGCQDEWIAIIQPDWGDGPYLTFEYDHDNGKTYENAFFGEHTGFIGDVDGTIFEAHESMTCTTLIEFVE